MSLRKLLLVIATAWAVCVLVLVMIRTTFVASISPSEYFAWTFLAGGPLIVTALIIRGAIASASMVEVLQNTERSDGTSLEAVRGRLQAMQAPPVQR